MLPLKNSSLRSSQPMFRPRLRGDWRGPPVVLASGEEMVTRAGAARRYWTSGELPWTQWSEYSIDDTGEMVRTENLTQRREWDERYGIGGHPGWLGWGGLSLREYAQWLRERQDPTIVDVISARERLEHDKMGWPFIFTDPFQEGDELNRSRNMGPNPSKDLIVPQVSDACTQTPAPATPTTEQPEPPARSATAVNSAEDAAITAGLEGLMSLE